MKDKQQVLEIQQRVTNRVGQYQQALEAAKKAGDDAMAEAMVEVDRVLVRMRTRVNAQKAVITGIQKDIEKEMKRVWTLLCGDKDGPVEVEEQQKLTLEPPSEEFAAIPFTEEQLQGMVDSHSPTLSFKGDTKKGDEP
jgi:uncharacterized protein YihD (DUF1040 family)